MFVGLQSLKYIYYIIGVADGVGGWNEEGVDPSFFSKVLMESCSRVSVRETVDLRNPVQILSCALKEVTWFHSKCYGNGYYIIYIYILI